MKKPSRPDGITSAGSECIEQNVRMPGRDLKGIGLPFRNMKSPSECACACKKAAGCKFFVFNHKQHCWLKHSDAGRRSKKNSFAGTGDCARKVCPDPPISDPDPDPIDNVDPMENENVDVGEFIQKEEIATKPNNLIKVLPYLGSEYKIKFELFVPQFKKSNWYSVLMFSVDKGLKNNRDTKYGERNPAIYIKNGKLYITAAISGNPDHGKANLPLTVDKWITVEIGQGVLAGKLIYYIKINNKMLYKVENNKPCLFKGINVFAGQPASAMPTISGKIKNLYYETSDKTNKGKCVVDYRQKPVDPSGVIQGKELVLKKNQLITVLPYMGLEYVITFELYLHSYQTRHPHYSVLHFTTSGNTANYGDRNPGIWITKDKYLQVNTALDGIKNVAYKDCSLKNFIPNKPTLPLRTWIKIKISQILLHKKYIFEIMINGHIVHTQENSVPADFTNMKVFAGDPWYPVQDGKIRNLVFRTKQNIPRSSNQEDTCPVPTGQPLNKADINHAYTIYNHTDAFDIKKDNLLSTLPYLGKEYVIMFELRIKKITNAQYQSVLHLTADGQDGKMYGSRTPALWVMKDGKFHISSAINGNKNNWSNVPGAAVEQWIRIELSQTVVDEMSDLYEFDMWIDNKKVLTKENPKAKHFDGVKVFAGFGGPYQPLEGEIRNLYIYTQN